MLCIEEMCQKGYVPEWPLTTLKCDDIIPDYLRYIVLISNYYLIVVYKRIIICLHISIDEGWN